MNSIVLDYKELKNILRCFGKDIIKGIEDKRRKEPLKNNIFNCSDIELLEHLENTREKRKATRIMISRLHKAYEVLSEEKKVLLKLHLMECKNWDYLISQFNYSSRTLTRLENDALNEILNKYNELVKIDIEENLFDDSYFLDV